MKLETIEPVFVDVIPEQLDEGKIYISKEFHTASHLCACGCGKLVVTPFSGSNSNWGLIENDGKVTLDGSIGNKYFECKSHYHIQGNKIVWDTPMP